MRFGDGYREDVSLSDGTPVRLRLVRPSDKELLREGFDRLSPESRYRRFFTERAALSEADLRYFTEVDGVRHFAFGALCRDADGRQRGIGVARFVSDDGVVAEPAIAVVDDMQGKGLGRILLERLVAAARERGVQRFRAEVLAVNEPMRKLLAEITTDQGSVSDAGVLAIDVPLEHEPRRAPLFRLLALVAQGVVVARLALARAFRSGHADEAPGGGAPATDGEGGPSGDPDAGTGAK